MTKQQRQKAAWRRRNREQVRASNRESYARHAEDRRQRSRAWREKNVGYGKAKTAEFRAAHPNYQRERYAVRKLRAAWSKFVSICAANRGPA